MEEKSIEVENDYVRFELIEFIGNSGDKRRSENRKMQERSIWTQKRNISTPPNINASKYDGFSHKLERVLFYASA